MLDECQQEAPAHAESLLAQGRTSPAGPDPFSRIPKHDAGHTPKKSSEFYVSGLQPLMDQAI